MGRGQQATEAEGVKARAKRRSEDAKIAATRKKVAKELDSFLKTNQANLSHIVGLEWDTENTRQNYDDEYEEPGYDEIYNARVETDNPQFPESLASSLLAFGHHIPKDFFAAGTEKAIEILTEAIDRASLVPDDFEIDIQPDYYGDTIDKVSLLETGVEKIQKQLQS